ncbi:DUF4752 family protein [Citrobacter freundii]|uniref:DUF4752 family protein n=1 Tax=Citrobacter freundii TaxID=546 RepID=UPI001A2B81C6|nr:DUF4752 family protein [Citrobacter freundii]HAT3963861.1 DUF4752 family protein [Citrobacter freundii]
MGIIDILNVGLAFIGWLFIIVCAGNWFSMMVLKQWSKRRKQTRREKALNELCDAFDLMNIELGTTVRLASKGDVVIMMYRKEDKCDG